jgi:tetratricopeptide (TPR) repeat protein
MEMEEMMKDLMTKQADSRLSSEIRDGFALLDLARGWLKQGNPVVAGELLKSAIESTEVQRDRRLRARVLKETGRTMMMQSDWDRAESHYLEAQRLFVEAEDLQGAAECARNRANMYFQKGMYRESEELCEKALEWASMLEEHELRATILNTLAAIKSTIGEHRESIQTFMLCLADFQAAGNRIRQGYVLLNIGLCQLELEEYSEAVGSLNEALAIAFSEKDLNLVEICYQNISRCYLAQKETNLAKSVIDTARKILPGLNSRALEAELNLIDCRILRTMGSFREAESLLEVTLTMALDNQLTALQADILMEQGYLSLETGHTELAESRFNAAARQYRQLGVDRGLREAVRALDNLKGETVS